MNLSKMASHHDKFSVASGGGHCTFRSADTADEVFKLKSKSLKRGKRLSSHSTCFAVALVLVITSLDGWRRTMPFSMAGFRGRFDISSLVHSLLSKHHWFHGLHTSMHLLISDWLR